MSLTIRPLLEEEFEKLQDDWNTLLDRSRSDSVFLRWEWIFTWWQTFKKDRELHILVAHWNERLVGIAPFYIDNAPGSKTRSLRFCSDELGPDYLDIIVEPDFEAAVGLSLRRYLQSELRNWDILHLDNLKKDAVLRLYAPIRGDSEKLYRSSHRCPAVQTLGSFEDYIVSRSALKRFSLHKKEKTLFEDKGVTHVTVHNDQELERGFKDLFELHARRAQAKALDTNFTSDAIERFHVAVGKKWLPVNILSLQLLYHQEAPICAHYLLKFKKRMFYFQSGFDPAWSTWSPSMVLLRRNIQQAFQEGFEEFDFLKGTEPYKMLWSNTVHDEEELLAFNNTWRGNFVHGIQTLKHIKHWIVNTAPESIVPHQSPQVTPGS